jgi:alkaline phosphatase D
MNKLYTYCIAFNLIICSNLAFAENYKIGFGSCLDQDLPQPIWETVLKDNIDSFIFLGDNVYGDSEDGLLNKMKKSYKTQKEMLPNWLKDTQLFYIWDDHDFGVNDGGQEYPLKNEAQVMYLNFWETPENDNRHKRDGIYFSSIIDNNNFKIKVIGLDTRFFRSTTLDRANNYKIVDQTKKPTMLGKDQWNWFEDEIKEEVDLLIVLSSVQVLPRSHQFEKWNLFPQERSKLLALLSNLKTPKIILSGDRHRAGIYKHADLIEVTSSSLNKPIADKWYEKAFLNIMPEPIRKKLIDPKEQDELQIGELISEVNYGLMGINTENKEISLEIKNVKGEILKKEVLKL